MSNEDEKNELAKYYWRDMCCQCGVVHGITVELFEARRDSEKRGTYCPNGHVGLITTKWIKDMQDRIKTPFEEFKPMICSNCGIKYLLETYFEELKKERGGNWHCPNGCSQRYTKVVPPPAPSIPKTPADVDYEKLIAYHNALGVIAGMEPKTWKNKKLLKQAILVARNALELQVIKEELKK